MTRLNTPEELLNFRQEILSKRNPDNPCISICAGAGCVASGASEVIEAFKAEIENHVMGSIINLRKEALVFIAHEQPDLFSAQDEH